MPNLQSTDEIAADLSNALNEFFKERDSNPTIALQAMALTTAALLNYFKKELGADLAESHIELIRKRMGQMAS
jgi:hypothetical protein